MSESTGAGNGDMTTAERAAKAQKARVRAPSPSARKPLPRLALLAPR